VDLPVPFFPPDDEWCRPSKLSSKIVSRKERQARIDRLLTIGESRVESSPDRAAGTARQCEWFGFRF